MDIKTAFKPVIRFANVASVSKTYLPTFREPIMPLFEH